MRFRIGNILRDYDLMEKARDLAIETIAADLTAADELARRLLGMRVAEAAARD